MTIFKLPCGHSITLLELVFLHYHLDGECGIPDNVAVECPECLEEVVFHEKVIVEKEI